MTNYLIKRGVCFLTVFLLTGKIFAQHPDTILLKNYRPKSLFKVPVTTIHGAKFPVIDMHNHEYVAKNREEIQKWVALMDKNGVKKTILLTGAAGPVFDSIANAYAPFKDRFELWCGIDFSGFDEPGWSGKAVKELERCVKMGATGMGELGDKGLGEIFCRPKHQLGIHLDNEKLNPLYEKCAALKIPVSIHVADPLWMYEPMDNTNDGLMNAYEWRIDPATPNLWSHDDLVKMLEKIVSGHPNTTFVVCHLANCEYDLSILGNMFAKYKNMYADLGARYAEIAPVPRYTSAFITKYKDRIVYGTDMSPWDYDMYETTFRVLQTNDEHFYAIDLTGYHWPLQGLGLSDEVLKKIYNGNAAKILKKQ